MFKSLKMPNKFSKSLLVGIADSSFVVLISGIIVLLVAVLVLLGWLFDIALMAKLQPQWTPMSISTALCFLLSGLVLILSALFKQQSWWLPQKLFSATVLLVASLALIESLFDIQLGIDLPDLHEPLQPDNHHPGRMAPNTALAFICFSVGLLIHYQLIRYSKRAAKDKLWPQLLAFAVLILGVTGVSGYLLDLAYLYSWFDISRMALPTALCMIFLAIALFNLKFVNGEEAEPNINLDVRKVYQTAVFVLTFISVAAGVAGFSIMAQPTEKTYKIA